MLSDKKRLQIANICYANVAGEFATFSNPKNRGQNFSWEWFIAHCKEIADVWVTLNYVAGPRTLIQETARQYAAEIATTLVQRATE